MTNATPTTTTAAPNETAGLTTYLITFYQQPGPPPGDLDLGKVMADLELVNRDIRAAGGWVFAGGLAGPEAATTVRHQAGKALVTDGPFIEAKEGLGGLTIVRAADLDVALGWATRLAEATGLPLEVRPFMGA